MSLRKSPNGYGLGRWSYFLEAPEDVALLPARVRRLVSREVLDLFAGFPGTMRERARRATLAPLGKWLRSLAKARCELEVHCRPRAPASVMLRFHQGDWAPAIEPVVVPKKWPAVLREVYELGGAINTDYAGSGFLVAPRDVYSAHDLVRRTWQATAPALRAYAFYGSVRDYPGVDLKRARSLWEVDGDVLFWTSDGSTFWLGHEHHGGKPGAPWGSLDRALGRMLRALLARERFHAR